MYKSINLQRKVCGFLLIISVLSGALNVSAQMQKTSGQKCTSGAWTGSITYARTQALTSNKTVERVSGRGEDITGFEMNYDYKASVAVIEAPEKNGSSIGRATINHTMTSTETIVGKEKNSCDRGKTWQEMTGNSVSKTETTGSASRLDANVGIGISEDGTYSVSVALPQIQGKVTGSQTSSFSGQCTAKEGKSFNLPPTETSIDGNSLTSDGTTRVNPSDPNKLSGSYSKTWENVTETISWNLQKCGAPLRITDLKFEHMKFPTWNDWKEISEQVGTIDGNLVKMKATVLNASGETKYAEIAFKETYKGDKWDGAKPDMPLKDNTVYVSLDAGEQKDVEILWDSSGYAWFDDGRPRLVQRVKAEIWENNKLTDDMTKNLKIAPKPVVLVHGAWSHWKEFETWQNIFTTMHSYDWKAFPVGENLNKGIMNTGRDFLSSEETNTTAQNAEAVKSYIKYAQEDRNAWHIDVVAHSIGGLIARYYISRMMPANYDDGRPQIEHLVMLGTPNAGSPCADVMDFAFRMTGSSPRIIQEMRQDSVAEFNKTNFNSKGVKFSALAGSLLPTMCKQIEWNDGFVSVPSATYKVKDNALSKSLHKELTSTKDFSDFVKPHLAVGPRADHMPEMPDTPNQTGENKNAFAAVFVNAAYKDNSVASGVFDENRYKPDFAKAVTIQPKQTTEIEIPVEQALNFGVTFMADPQISATLYDDKGTIAGKNLTNTPEANNWFRSIFVSRAVTAGTWKLKLENTSDKELKAVVAAWSNAGVK
jgi:uncharacterized alpha/beta hydrolase family protein